MYRSRDYTDISRRWNITEEAGSINYTAISFGLGDLTDRDGGNRDDGRISDEEDGNRLKAIQPPCYCDNVFRDLAVQYKNYHGYIALMVCSFGTLTNVLNIIVLTRKDTKAVPINRILTGLAVADMLVMLEYMPFAIYKYLVLPQCKRFLYGWAVFVLFHMHFTQLFHTISIALTLALAVWRYIAIKFPQHNHIWCTGRRCTIAISCSVLAPFIACAPSYLVFGIRMQTSYENGTMEKLYYVDADYSVEKSFIYQLNFWILGVIVKLLPCILLTVIIIWLIKALYRRRGRKQILKNYDDCTTRVATSSARISSIEIHDELSDTKRNGCPRRASKFDKRTNRTTKMLVVVLLLFLATEIPQGVLGLLSAVLGDCFFRNCYHTFGEFMDILALLNGSISFILYCFMSRQFRLIFGQLFKPKIMNKWPPINQQHIDVQSTFV